MDTIGLIAAMQSESDAILRLVKGWKRITMGSFRGYRFEIMDRDCVLVTSGVGIKRAADAALVLLEWSRPSLLISFGIAGAVNPDLNIGDVVIAGNSYLLDKCLLSQRRPLATLTAEAWKETSQALQSEGSRLLTGTVITTHGPKVVEQLLGKMPHPILEMETAGITPVAAKKGIPVLSIRSISDGPKSPIPLDLEAVMDEEYNFRIGRILLMVLSRPKIIFQTKQMMQNSSIAAANAALALVTALTQPRPLIAFL